MEHDTGGAAVSVSPSASPVIDMRSTEVTRPGDSRPSYLVHGPDAKVPEPFEPKCAATCWCRR
jgi:hypothetical protein